MNLKFEQAVDDCVALMRAGATLEYCLVRYPQYARELQPILQTAKNLQALPVPQERIESIQAGKQRLLSAYAKKASAQPVSESPIPRFIQRIAIKLTGKDDLDMKLVTRFAIVVLLVVGLLVGGGFSATASANALPGDTLYPLKLRLEDLNLLFAKDPQVRQQLELQYQDARQQEILSVLRLHRHTQVQFTGILSAVNADSWIIGGLNVKLDSGTQIVGAAALGASINVAGETLSDGTLLAHSLTVQGQANNPMMSTPGTGPMTSPTQGQPYPATSMPTMMPTLQATLMPTMMATQQLTFMPSMMPTHQPTAMPSMMPTHRPTSMPSMMPTMMATKKTTSMPTMMPTMIPTSMRKP